MTPEYLLFLFFGWDFLVVTGGLSGYHPSVRIGKKSGDEKTSSGRLFVSWLLGRIR